LIIDWGFKCNPYDWRVMNKIINRKQFTILWHVDDLKLSHEDPNTITEVLQIIDKRYGKVVLITMMHGKVHNYLGMVLDYSKRVR
jgi:hypothetical protein